jgi:hypothetical protein
VRLRVLGQIEDWIIPFPYGQNILWSIDAARFQVMLVGGRWGRVVAGWRDGCRKAGGRTRTERAS